MDFAGPAHGRHLKAVGFLAAIAVYGVSVADAAITEISTCDQAFSGRGVLVQDLNCAGFAAITVEGGTLDLAGHTVTGGERGIFSIGRSCHIFSSVPGATIRQSGIAVAAAGNVKITNLTIEDVNEGVYSAVGSIRIRDSAFTNVAESCTDGFRRVLFERSSCDAVASGLISRRGPTVVVESTISGASVAAVVDYVKIKGSTIANNPGVGVLASAGKIRTSTVTDNGDAGVVFGMPAFKGNGRLRVDESNISNNGVGVRLEEVPNKLDIRRSVIAGNFGEGILSDSTDSGDERIRIRDSEITGNGLSGISHVSPAECRPVIISDTTVAGNGLNGTLCGVSQTCADISVCLPPGLSDVTCETSHDSASGFPGTSWGVCEFD